jgi:hypothetical protein
VRWSCVTAGSERVRAGEARATPSLGRSALGALAAAYRRIESELGAPSVVVYNAVLHLAHQDRSAWTFELDLRPFGEEW